MVNQGSYSKGIHRHGEGIPLCCAFCGRYLTTSLYHTVDWCVIGVEQNLSEGWADDTDVMQSCLPVY